MPFADNLPKPYFNLPASLEESFSLPSKVSPPCGTSTLPAFMTTFGQTASPFCFLPGLFLEAKHKEMWSPSPVLGELPVPPGSSELVLFPGIVAAAGQWQGRRGWAALCHLRAFTSGSPGKQRETRECASKKLKLMRATSTVWELDFPFLWGIPWFCNGLLFSAGSKPTRFGISYETKLEKDKQIL